ncbi:Hypothetical protein DHA2_7792 [Giardia duodenalis]|uniref:Leucine-rich repeat protein n=1 Tax=Giardia intestinalis TaxID=5741 RepID=V6TBI1_GIAIN|nr:Hypothetical protein DHA2_7792 [Giardia intestinalis]
MDNTAQYLRELTGIEDLSMVESLSLIIDVSTQSLDQLSMLLPNLKVLNVSHSEVTILDISSAFPNLRELILDECELSDLTGIFMLSNLKKFRARSNCIEDLSPFLECFTLEVIDLCHNSISDFSALYSLTHLPLVKLLVSDNPFWTRASDHQAMERCLQELFPRVMQFSYREQSPESLYVSLRLAAPTAKLLKHSKYAIGTNALFNSPSSLLRRKRNISQACLAFDSP